MLSEWGSKLITKEDPYHLHQILGLAVLTSYAWRLSQWGDADMGFARYPRYTVPTILLHLLLHASSFQFQIPTRRIKDGSRQWPEYRLHALVFCAGSLGACWIVHYERQHGLVKYNWNFVLILLRLLLADVSSWSVTQPSRTIRDLRAPVAAKYYFSATQFFVTSFVLLGGGLEERRCSLFFYFAMVIQVTAFQLTLRRKNLVSLPVSLVLYGSLLGGGFLVGVYELLVRTHGDWLGVHVVVTMGCLAAVWRTGPLPGWMRNKYVVWTVMHFVVVQRYLRPVLEGRDNAVLSRDQMPFLAAVMLLLMLLNGVYKHYEGRIQSSS